MHKAFDTIFSITPPIRGRGGLFAGAIRLLSALAYLSTCGSVAATPALDQPAPQLTAVQMDGQVFDLSKLRGRVVLVTYWATWCAPCKKEMPILSEFYRKHHSEGLELIGISADRPEDFGKARKMSRSVSYPTALNSQITDNGFGAPEGFPLTYVIDGDGIVRDKFVEVRDELLKDVVLPLLSRKPDGQKQD